MRTLLEIIDFAKSGQMPTHEECYYAMLALSALHFFDHHALQELDDKNRQSPFFIEIQSEESFKRFKNALAKSPQEWVGWDNDPKNPDYQKRRKGALNIFNKVMEQTK